MKKTWNRMMALLLCLIMVSVEAFPAVKVQAYEPDGSIIYDELSDESINDEGVVIESADYDSVNDEGVVIESDDEIYIESDADTGAQDLNDKAEDFIFVPGYIEVPGDRKTTKLDTDKDYLELRNELIKSEGDNEEISADLLGVDVDMAAASDAAYPAAYSQTSSIQSFFNTKFPPVRNQNPYGTCWAHSAMSLCEFYMASHGLVNSRTDVDYSELHLVYYDYTQGTPSIAGDTGDKVNYTNTSYGTGLKGKMDAGGNLLFAAQTLLCQRGAVAESVAPYPSSGTPVAPASSTERQNSAYLRNAYEISMSNPELIKEAIVNNGVVGVSIDWDAGYYNGATNAFYCPSVSETNHAVSIVGWDDNFLASNFKTNPGRNGAWLVRNSWNYEGSQFFSENQYFWMSYADKSVTENAWVYEMASSYNYDNHYYYDSQIHNTGSSNYSSGAYYSANVYQAKGGLGEVLKAVGFGVTDISSQGTPYEITIYKNVAKGGNPSSGTLYSEATTTGTLYFDGYYTVDLSSPVTLSEGEYFAVVIKRTDSRSVEIETSGSMNNGVSYKVGMQSGQSFSSNNGKYWSTHNWDGFGNFSIGAYTTNSSSGPTPTPTPTPTPAPTEQVAAPTANPVSGSKVAVGSTITLSTATTGANIYYTLDGSVPSSSKTLYSGPLTIGESFAGKALKIRAIAVKDGYDDSDVSEFNYTVNASQAMIQLSLDSIEFHSKNTTAKLTATVYKADGTIDNSASVSYVSSDPSVATVSQSGVVTAVANGEATITATSGKLSAVCTVTVDIPNEKVEAPTVNPASGSELAIGSKVVLSCKTEGASIYYTKDGRDPASYGVLYSSPIEIDDTYAGKTLTIRAYAKKNGCDDSDAVSFEYTVSDSQARIELSKDSVKLEKKDATETLTATVYKADGTIDNTALVSFISSDPKVATVSKTGVITAVANGEATITVTSDKLSAACLVTVDIPKEKVEAPTANFADLSKLAVGSKIILSTQTEDAVIYYTMDASTPSPSGLMYKEPITVDESYAGKSLTIRAIAVKEGWEDSDISKFNYTIDDSQARLELSDYSILFDTKGATCKLAATVYNADGSVDDKAVVNYKSSNAKIAAVSKDGTVTAGVNGEATITASYGQLTAECSVTVDVKGDKPEPDPDPDVDKEFKVVGISDDGYPYTGSAITPKVSVYYGETLLKEGSDYKLSYKNNKQASGMGYPDAEVLVTLIGNYSGTISVPFTILKKNINDPDVVIVNTTSVYNGKAQKLKPALYYMGKAISTKEYYVGGLNSSGYREVGDYPITFNAEASRNFTGTIETNISIKDNYNMINLAKVSFYLEDPNFSFVYDGNPKEPVYASYDISSDDYFISYSNNVAIGKATAVISALPESESCYGNKTITFKIIKPPVIDITYNSDIEVSLFDESGDEIDEYSVPYAAGGARPGPRVTYGGEEMTEGVDYKVSYKNNKKCGDAYVIITGKGAYKGRQEIPFWIVEQDLENLTLIASDVVYSSKPYAYQKTKLTLTDTDGKVLKAGKDYEKFKTGAISEGLVFDSPSSVPDAGDEITVTLTGKGNYTGTISATYRIIEKSQDISKAKVTILRAPEYKGGEPVTLDKDQIMVVFKGVALADEDYDIISYSNNRKAGKGAKVTIRGVGEYGGLKTVSFTIAPKAK